MDELVEDTVDELGGLGTAEALGEFDGFVDRGAVGRIGVEDLIC